MTNLQTTLKINLALLLTFIPLIMMSQLDLTYQEPHEDILTLADVKMPPWLRMTHDGSKGIMLYRNQYKTLAELSEKEMRLAGLRINPVTNISSRARYFTQLTKFDPSSGKETDIQGLPKDARITNISWNNQETRIAFTNTSAKGVELWYVDYESGQAHKIMDDLLNANMGKPFTWLSDGKSFLVRMLPKERAQLIDQEDAIPTGPTISENEEGTKAQNRTYQDLLKNPTDEANFVTLSQSEIYKVNLDGKKELWKGKGMYRSFTLSPDGKYVLISEVQKPFSYIVPYYRFPTDYSVFDLKGKKVKTVVEVPLVEELPKGFMAVRTGIRNISWRSDKPATLVWAEALDNGDPEEEVDYRDEVFELAAPFKGEKKPLIKTVYRYSGIDWAKNDIAVIYDYWWNNRMLRTSIFDPSDASKESVLFNERNYQDRYSDPGIFVEKENEYGKMVLDVTSEDNLMLLGDGYSENGKLPFVDRYDISENKTTRLYQSEEGELLEDLVKVMDVNNGIILTRLESSSKFPNYYLRNIKTGELNAITDFKNPFKAIQNVQKEVITYKRDDGLELNGTLYLPVDYKKGEKYPMILWAYPVEYKDKNSAGQVTSSSNEFTYPYYGSPIYWVNRGYVVLDDAAFPIMGEGDEEPNDSFRKQLVANAKAAIDAVDDLGYIDRNKVAVGGHSYGAFMTANLLTHSNLFAAGIARSGAYNRSLTPFGFQSEERNYWEAPEIYYEMSPFSHADKMKTPLLLIHGEADNNSGTYPMQSERYFNALKGLGAPVRLVMLPKESHGYAARENIMHMLWEQDQWLEKYVKNRTSEE